MIVKSFINSGNDLIWNGLKWEYKASLFQDRFEHEGKIYTMFTFGATAHIF